MGGGRSLKIGMFTVSDMMGMSFANFVRERSLELASGDNLVQWNLISLSGVFKKKGFWERSSLVLSLYNYPSYYHAMALNLIPLYEDEYDITVICDADFVLMRKNWDVELVELIEDNHIFGTLDIKWLLAIRPFFVAFRKGVLTTGLDFRPMDLSPSVEGKKGRGGRDTGCRILEYALKNDLRYKYMECEKVSPEFREYTVVYNYEGRVFGSHLGNMRCNEFDGEYAQSWREWVMEHSE